MRLDRLGAETIVPAPFSSWYAKYAIDQGIEKCLNRQTTEFSAPLRDFGSERGSQVRYSRASSTYKFRLSKDSASLRHFSQKKCCLLARCYINLNT
jgi:hypothetical protein